MPFWGRNLLESQPGINDLEVVQGGEIAAKQLNLTVPLCGSSLIFHGSLTADSQAVNSPIMLIYSAKFAGIIPIHNTAFAFDSLLQIFSQIIPILTVEVIDIM